VDIVLRCVQVTGAEPEKTLVERTRQKSDLADGEVVASDDTHYRCDSVTFPRRRLYLHSFTRI